MKDFFSVGQAAEAAGTTRETLRHYDRIGLVKPSYVDPQSGYRYYTSSDLVRIHTVRALQQMDLPLQKIREVLDYDDLSRILAVLSEAEKKADEKIAGIQCAKERIRAAKLSYAGKLRDQQQAGEAAVIPMAQRRILLADAEETPTLNNLWNYLRPFYEKVPEAMRGQASFADTAGIYTENGISRLFAVCLGPENLEGLKTLPAGDYLCADCTGENRQEKLRSLLMLAQEKYHAAPLFSVQQIQVSGILQWKYQIQIFLGRM